MTSDNFRVTPLLLPILVVALVAACEGINVEADLDEELAPLNTELPNPYETPWPPGHENPRSWGTLPEGREWGSTSAVHVDIDGTSMWVFERCGTDLPLQSCVNSDLDPILKFDSEGNLLQAIGAGLFVYPHGLHVDRDGNLWATDARGPNENELSNYPEDSEGKGHVVIKLSPDGEVLMTLGTPGVAGDPPDALTQPNATVTAPNGDIFVAESHSGTIVNRISKFAPDGTFLMSWGSSGSGPGEFNVPHDIGMDSQGRVFVADRLNYRIQIFDQEGQFLDEWRQFSQPSGIYIDPNDVLYVTDSHSWGPNNTGWLKGIRIGSARTGEVHYFLPDLEASTHANSGAEGIGADHAGNVYGAVVRRRGIEKQPVPVPVE